MNFTEAYKAVLAGRKVQNEALGIVIEKPRVGLPTIIENGVAKILISFLRDKTVAEEVAFFTSEAFELVREKVKKNGWLNIYPGASVRKSRIYATEEEATEMAAIPDRVACIPISWEEEEAS